MQVYEIYKSLNGSSSPKVHCVIPIAEGDNQPSQSMSLYFHSLSGRLSITTCFQRATGSWRVVVFMLNHLNTSLFSEQRRLFQYLRGKGMPCSGACLQKHQRWPQVVRSQVRIHPASSHMTGRMWHYFAQLFLRF